MRSFSRASMQIGTGLRMLESASQPFKPRLNKPETLSKGGKEYRMAQVSRGVQSWTFRKRYNSVKLGSGSYNVEAILMIRVNSYFQTKASKTNILMTTTKTISQAL